MRVQRRGRLNGLITPVLLAVQSGPLLAQPSPSPRGLGAPVASTATLERSWRQHRWPPGVGARPRFRWDQGIEGPQLLIQLPPAALQRGGARHRGAEAASTG
ncbi:MAG: hypothetical protein EBR33_13235 [Synechococcaceae bacterium WB4_1_0192]|nr:hypothetical protein [Synechococcaceae bacterium WB4_1_0192]